MAFGLDSLIGGGLSLFGAISAGQERAKAEAERQQAINQFAQANDQQYGNLVHNDNLNMYAAAGNGADAINSLGRTLGSDTAAAGVYNSSATSSALANASRGQDTAIANLAAQNRYNEGNLYNSNQSQIANMRLGLANSQYSGAINDQQTARSGLSSFLGNLAQTNLARSGANANRTASGLNGTMNQTNALPGNSGNPFSGGDVLAQSAAPNIFGQLPSAQGYAQQPMSPVAPTIQQPQNILFQPIKPNPYFTAASVRGY
jgi:hypothetical protein